MKEATGELNLTVIIVIAVAGLVAFFSFTLWPLIRSGIHSNNDCSNAVCSCKSEKCQIEKETGVIECKLTDDDEIIITCPYKG